MKKNDARSFCLFVYFQSYNNKSKNFVFINCAVKKQDVIYVNKEFLHKVLVLYFSSNIPVYIEKNLMKKLCKILEMKLKMYTPVSPRIFFKKTKFKVLHYIQHDFICQCLGINKDQASMFKYFVIN